MSETLATPTQATTPQAQSSQGQAKPSQAQPTNTKQVQNAGNQEGKTSQEVLDELEEIKIGTAKGKVPKELAKAIKEIEKNFHSKAQESASIRKQVQEFAKAAKANPEVFFKEFGIDPDQFSQERLAKKLQLEMMDPNQRKAMELEEENKRYKEDAEKRQEELKKNEDDKVYKAESQKLRQEMFQSWEKSGLPPDPRVGQWMAAIRAQADSQGLNWTWDDCAAKLIEDLVGFNRHMVRNLSPQQFQEFMGDEPLKKWREFDVKRVTVPAASLSNGQNQRPGKMPAIGNNQKKPGKLPALNESQWREWRESGMSVREWLNSKKN